jgi:hypothetical protein
LTILAWAAFVAFLKNADAASSVFALLALTAVPTAKRKRPLDERESAISHKALLAGMQVVWVSFVVLVVSTGFIKGWDATLSVPMWLLASCVWWAAMLLLAVECIAILVLYRGDHA